MATKATTKPQQPGWGSSEQTNAPTIEDRLAVLESQFANLAGMHSRLMQILDRHGIRDDQQLAEAEAQGTE